MQQHGRVPQDNFQFLEANPIGPVQPQICVMSVLTYGICGKVSIPHHVCADFVGWGVINLTTITYNPAFVQQSNSSNLFGLWMPYWNLREMKYLLGLHFLHVRDQAFPILFTHCGSFQFTTAKEHELSTSNVMCVSQYNALPSLYI